MIKDVLSLLPTPLQSDSDWVNLFKKLESYYKEYKQKIYYLRYSLRPDLTPFPRTLADSSGAIYKFYGDYEELRQVLYSMPTIQRQPQAFESWKPVIDKITGGDSYIWHGYILRGYFVINESLLGWKDYLGYDNTNLQLDTTNSLVINDSIQGVINQNMINADAIQAFDPLDLGYSPNGFILVNLNTVTPITQGVLDKVVSALSGLSEIMFVLFVGDIATNGIYQYYFPRAQIS